MSTATTAATTVSSAPVKGKLLVSGDGVLLNYYNLIITKSCGWFLILKSLLCGRHFDICIFDSEVILKLLTDFEDKLANANVDVFGEYRTTAYKRGGEAEASHSVSMKWLRVISDGTIYQANPELQDPLLYEMLVAQYIYGHWQEPFIHKNRLITHRDFFNRYLGLYNILWHGDKESAAPDADRPAYEPLPDTLHQMTEHRNELRQAVTTSEFSNVYALQTRIQEAGPKPTPRQKRSFNKNFKVAGPERVLTSGASSTPSRPGGQKLHSI